MLAGPGADVLAAGLAVLLQAQDEDFGLRAGPGAFWTFVVLGAVLVLLLLSMRKQMRRVRFDERGESDQERMQGVEPDGEDRPAG